MNTIHFFRSIKEVLLANKPADTIPDCQTCGACCAYFKVYFHPKNNPQLKLIEEKTNMVSSDRVYMKGTEKFKQGQCIALEGKVGSCVSCTIYKKRPDVCRQFQSTTKEGKLHPRCIEARKHHNIA